MNTNPPLEGTDLSILKIFNEERPPKAKPGPERIYPFPQNPHTAAVHSSMSCNGIVRSQMISFLAHSLTIEIFNSS